MSTMRDEMFKKLLESSLSELDQIVATNQPQDINLDEVANALDSYAVHLTRMAAYLSGRIWFGMNHKEAVRRQNSRAAKVRRAIGYTFPKLDISF